MSNEPKPSRFSARAGFFLGVATAAVIGALAFAAVRYDGNSKAAVAAPVTQVAASAATTETFPLAEHVAAMTGTQEGVVAPTAPLLVSPKAPATTLLSGTIELDPSATSVSGPVTVFVIARDKKGKGHPIFAKRLDVASFPTKFTLGPQDSMMGGAPPDTVSVEARIDLDHDAMTKEPGAPQAKIESVSMGSKDLTLTLKP
ncbi:MAG TPA: hypothetical protein VHX14_13700 [Thermoanaerobaculia bacterium]|jgi:hypothetical protein|nr:hypothetical protein [Thermoanaerobaculia bacterium]